MLKKVFMDKKEIVKTFFEHNILLSPQMLEMINENNINEILSRAKQSDTPIITDLSPKEISVEVRKAAQKKSLSPQDFAKYYNNKCDGIKNILLKKIGKEKEVVSINKTKNAFSDVLVIGMVKELTPQGFVLEDMTGEVDVISKQTPSMDDVVCVKGLVREARLFAKELILPDIPLSREIVRIDASILLTTDENANFVIVFNAEGKEAKKTLTSNPSWVSISKNSKKASILVYKPLEEADKQQAINYLKKRHLTPQRNQITSNEDYFLLDPIPDILWLVQKNSWMENYKGVNIISGVGPVKINLGTRAVEFVKSQSNKNLTHQTN